MPKNKVFFSYRDEIFTTLQQMLRQIIQDHRYINPKNLLITKISSIAARVVPYPKTRKCMRISTSSSKTNLSRYLILESYIYNNVTFVCNGKTFSLYYKALKYVLKKEASDHSLHTRRPSLPVLSSIGSGSLAHEKIYCRKFWTNLWRNCDYRCYSNNNSYLMKKKFLEELTYYRRKYDAGKLIENQQLSSIALIKLKEILSLNDPLNIKKFDNVGKGSLVTAPLILNRWFGER